MLKPAAAYRTEIEQEFKKLYYTEDMMYIASGPYSFIPNIAEVPYRGQMQYAIFDINGKLIGYIEYEINFHSSTATDFVLISFDKGNPTLGYDLLSILNKLIKDYKIHRIEFKAVSNNPVTKYYDKFCKKYKGTKHVFNDVFKDNVGKYHDIVIYEIIFKN